MSRYQVHDCYVNSQFRWFRFIDCFCESINFCVTWLSKPNKRCASHRKEIVYAHERTFLRSMTHCGSVMDSLLEVAFDHKAHRHGDEQNIDIHKWTPILTSAVASVNIDILWWILERIVCSNIMAHLDEYKLLSDRQHAFRKGHSCETQLTTVINDMAKILDNRGQVDTFILDFEKAFDTAPHELLKSKLFSYGIGGKTLKWMDSFLCFRQQRVVVNGVKSDWAPICRVSPRAPFLVPSYSLCT